MLKQVRWGPILTTRRSTEAIVLAVTLLSLPTLWLTGAGGSPAYASAERQTSVQATGSISGVVRFVGSQPDSAILQMVADPFCLIAHQGKTVTVENLVVNANGTLRSVFVYIRDSDAIGASVPIAQPVELNQVACVYQPRVLGVQTGATIKITNSDTTLHNVNVQATNNPSFNVAQPIPGMSIERSFANPEVMIPVKCDVHSWMRAYIGVLPHPYFAVTGKDGAFDISGLPAGDYVLEAWHETLGTRTMSMKVEAGALAIANFSFAKER